MVLRGAYRQSSKWRMSRRKSERRSGEGPTLDRSAVPPDVAALIGKAPTDTSRLGRQFLTNIKRLRHRRAMVNPRGLLLALPLGLGIMGGAFAPTISRLSSVFSSCFSSCGAFAPSRTTVE